MKIADVIRLLNSMVSDGVIDDYAIGGAVGATFYLEPLATVDLDVFVRLHPEPGKTIADPQPIFAFLASRGHAMEGEYVMVGDWPVQFLAPPGPLGEEALRRAVTVDVEGTPARVFGAEHLAAMALETGRAKDKARLLQFIESGALDAERFEAVVARNGLTTAWEKFKREFLDRP